MKHCTVYFKKNSDFRADAIPTEDELETNYEKIWWNYVVNDTTPEDIYRTLNDEDFSIIQRSINANHSQICVGDVIQFDNAYFLCQSVNWHQFKY